MATGGICFCELVAALHVHSNKQLLPEQRGPADNTSVGPVIFMMCEVASEGTVEGDCVSKTEMWQTNELLLQL